jgi:hypothetical protein
MCKTNKPYVKNIYLNENVGNGILWFGTVAFALFVVCAAFILFGHEQHRKLSIVLGAAWVVLVPIYFFFEHVYLFRKFGDPTQYDQFKRVQDLAAKIWAAAVLVMAAFYAETFPNTGG